MNQRKDAAKLIAQCMMGHYEDPIESFFDFFRTDMGDIDGIPEDRIESAGEYVNEHITSLYDNDNPECVAFRKEVLKQLEVKLKL